MERKTITPGVATLSEPNGGRPERPHADVREEPPTGRAFASLLKAVLDRELCFGFHYQPIVDLQRGTAVGYEALVRFPAEAKLAPDRWFAGAEECGRRWELEELVTHEALKARAYIPQNCFLSLNVSPDFLLSKHWHWLLESTPTLAQVVVEITEDASIPDYRQVLERIDLIRARSGCVAVDDAGSGYASLNHVMQLKPDFVKLDRIFVSDCDSDRANAAMIEMVGKTAGRLDAWIIAEGVETPAELDELMRLNVPLAQGYYLARPAPKMGPLDEEKTAAVLRRAQELTLTDTLSRSTELCTICSGREDAAALLADQPQADLAVVTDRWGRPVELLERHPLTGVRCLADFMRVQATSDPAEVLRRALTRPAATRFDPLAVINEYGQFEGVARIDRLTTQSLEALREGSAGRSA